METDKYKATLKAIRLTGTASILPEDAAKAAKNLQTESLANLTKEFTARQAILDLQTEDAQTKLDNNKTISEADRIKRQTDLNDIEKFKQAQLDADKEIAENAINLAAAVARARAGQEGS